jgi:hypothetical protein
MFTRLRKNSSPDSRNGATAATTSAVTNSGLRSPGLAPRRLSILSKKNTVTNAQLIQTFEPGIQFPLETLPGKVFLCTKEKDASQTIHKLHYLGITQSQIIELHDHSPSSSSTVSVSMASQGMKESKQQQMMVEVVECHELNALVKVKYKRDEIITFQFQSGAVVRYYMFDSTACAAYIKQLMSKSGIPSTTHLTRPKLSPFSLSHTSASTSASTSATASLFSQQKNQITSQNLLFYIKEIESQFTLKPSHDLVIQMVDLLRDAVECFGESEEDDSQQQHQREREASGRGEIRSQSVVSYVQSFLQREDVIQILDQQNQQKPSLSSPAPSATVPPVGEIPQLSPIMSSSEVCSSSLADASDEREKGCDEATSPLEAEPQQGEEGGELMFDDGEAETYSLLFLTPLGENDYESDSSSCDDQNPCSYLPLQPLVAKQSEAEGQAATGGAQSTVAVPWDEEGIQLLIQQTIHDIDSDEAELGIILTALDRELEKILGSTGPLATVEDEGKGKATGGGDELTEEGAAEASFTDDLVTFEEFDSFLEELNEGGDLRELERERD